MSTSTASLKSDSGFVDNWQTGKSLADCNLHMLTSEDSCDVSFRVGKDEKIVRAHRYVLISRSCVFHAMLCGPLAEKDDIKILDAEADIFLDLLKFLYIDTASPKPGNVTGLLYLAKKYAVGGLERQCLNYLETSLSAENACVILEQAHVFDEKQLCDRALKTILENAETCIATQGFTELSHECFNKVISSDDFAVKPEKTFSAAISWAEKECRRQEREINPANLRSVFGEALYSIPFQYMDQKHYVKVVAPKDILTKDENIVVMTCLLCPENDPSPFKRWQAKSKQTGNTDLILYDGYMKIASLKSGQTIHGRHDFTFNVDVLLCGLYVLQATHYMGRNIDEYTVQVNKRVTGELIKRLVSVSSSTNIPGDHVKAIYLEEPVPIAKDIGYYVYVESMCLGTQQYVGNGIREEVNVGEYAFRRIHQEYSSTVNDIVYGLIIKK